MVIERKGYDPIEDWDKDRPQIPITDKRKNVEMNISGSDFRAYDVLVGRFHYYDKIKTVSLGEIGFADSRDSFDYDRKIEMLIYDIDSYKYLVSNLEARTITNNREVAKYTQIFDARVFLKNTGPSCTHSENHTNFHESEDKQNVRDILKIGLALKGIQYIPPYKFVKKRLL